MNINQLLKQERTLPATVTAKPRAVISTLMDNTSTALTHPTSAALQAVGTKHRTRKTGFGYFLTLL